MKHFQTTACLLAFFICHLLSFCTATKGRRTTRPLEPDTEPTGAPPQQKTRTTAKKTERQANIAAPPPAVRHANPNNEPHRPARRIQHKGRYVGLQPVPPHVPAVDETGFYMWPRNYWFNPNRNDAQLLADRTFNSMEAAFASYGQRQIAMARMSAELQRHQQAWESGTRSRFYNNELRRGVFDPNPNATTWSQAANQLQAIWLMQYHDALRTFLVWYRDFLLHHLALWFAEYGVAFVLPRPQNNNRDQDANGENDGESNEDNDHSSHWRSPG